ncbi:MAG TPA: hypothetical protein VHN78_15980, partial [Chloroflexota bacterium]|nr:hypothetical protein [Chloroflexota bacterium]
MARFIFARHPRLEQSWPFVQPRLVERLASLGEVEVVSAERDQALSALTDLQTVDGVALFGGRLTEDCVTRAPRLRMVGCNTDNTGRGLPLDALRGSGIPVV